MRFKERSTMAFYLFPDSRPFGKYSSVSSESGLQELVKPSITLIFLYPYRHKRKLREIFKNITYHFSTECDVGFLEEIIDSVSFYSFIFHDFIHHDIHFTILRPYF